MWFNDIQRMWVIYFILFCALLMLLKSITTVEHKYLSSHYPVTQISSHSVEPHQTVRHPFPVQQCQGVKQQSVLLEPDLG